MKLQGYFKKNHYHNSKMIDSTLGFIDYLSKEFYGISYPDVAIGPDNMIQLCWDYKDNFLSVDLYENGDMELFYKNRKTGELWGEDIKYGDDLKTVKYFNLFCDTRKEK